MEKVLGPNIFKLCVILGQPKRGALLGKAVEQGHTSSTFARLFVSRHRFACPRSSRFRPAKAERYQHTPPPTILPWKKASFILQPSAFIFLIKKHKSNVIKIELYRPIYYVKISLEFYIATIATRGRCKLNPVLSNLNYLRLLKLRSGMT